MRTYLSVFEEKERARQAAVIIKKQGVDPNQITMVSGRPGHDDVDWPDAVKKWRDKGFTVLLAQVMEYLEPRVKETMTAQKPVHMQVLAGNIGDEAWMDDMRYVPTPHTKDLFEDEEEGLNYDERISEYYPHYNQVYAAAGVPYNRYTDAYRFGALLAEDIRYQDRSWADIARQVEERWTRDHPAGGDWKDVEEAIQYAWRVNRPEKKTQLLK